MPQKCTGTDHLNENCLQPFVYRESTVLANNFTHSISVHEIDHFRKIASARPKGYNFKLKMQEAH
jgi:hypothetical protein